MSTSISIDEKVTCARAYFNTHETLDYATRIQRLIKLKISIEKNEEEIYKALKSDLNKSTYEANMTEVGLTIGELEHTIKKLKKWMKPKRHKVAFTQMPATVKMYSEPYGVVLIMSPWNYPFQLTMVPLIGALAAGNCAVVKPSAYSPKTSDVIHKIISEMYDDGIQVVMGGREENEALLESKFDYIFFTGSPSVGKIVMKQASKHLTPVTLELGGKSPCIVDKTADIDKTAKRILFGKLLNAGQTCVAPDYLLVQQEVKESLVNALIKTYKAMLLDDQYQTHYYPKIINEKHYLRLKRLIEDSDVLYGGKCDDHLRQIDLTLIDCLDLNSTLMQEEIFGPIFPIIAFKTVSEVIAFVNARPKPLALYAFTKDIVFENNIIKHISYGGGCINDTIIHISASNQPFGGVGNSGMGAYHGKASFDTFSHQKNVLKKWWHFDLPLRYHPYQTPDKKLNKLIFKTRD